MWTEQSHVALRFMGAFTAAVVLVVAPVDVSATVVIQPNTIEHDLQAEHCFQDTDPDVCIPCNTECMKDQNKVGAAIYQCVIGAPVGTRDSRSSISVDVKIAAADSNKNELVPTTFVYDVWWKGNVAVFGGAGGDLRNDTYVSVRMALIDQESDLRVYNEEIHTIDVEKDSYIRNLVVFGAYHDEGREQSSFTVVLRTGRVYRFQLTLRCHSRLDFLPIPPVYYCLDYAGGNRGAGWNFLKVFAGQDASQIVDETNAKIEMLSEQLEHHTHPYLTGHGEGHNNTAVETGQAIIPGDQDEASVSSSTAKVGATSFPKPTGEKTPGALQDAQTDVDGSGATDLIDVIKVIDAAFRNRDGGDDK